MSSATTNPPPGGHTLVVRLDNAGDLLLAGPALRAAASGSDRVTVLCAPAAVTMAALLPGVDDVVCWDAPWVGAATPAADAAGVEHLIDELRRRRFDRAAVLVSFHQSARPAARLLRRAGVAAIAAVSEDQPGSLVDHRLARHPGLHEVETNLAVLDALGLRLPASDDGRLEVRLPERPVAVGSRAPRPFVVVHPGASAPARSLPADRLEPIIDDLLADGRAVVVTGSGQGIRPLPRQGVTDLAGHTDLAELAPILQSAAVFVGGNSGPAHLAAAVGTPVVSIFAPVVPWTNWRPWGVPTIPLSMDGIHRTGCHAQGCPSGGRPCLAEVTPAAVCAAVRCLAGSPSLFGGASPHLRVDRSRLGAAR